MDEKICLDSDASITILKEDNRIDLIKKAIDNKEIFLSAVTVFELFLRKTNLEIVEEFISRFKILDIDKFVARKASNIHKELQQRGEIIDIRDLLIASSCIINNCKLLTFNKRDFERIKELKLIKIENDE